MCSNRENRPRYQKAHRRYVSIIAIVDSRETAQIASLKRILDEGTKMKTKDIAETSLTPTQQAASDNEMTSKDFIVTIVPRWADIDLNQHMRNSAFADWAAYARTERLNANGFTMPKLVQLEMTPIMFEDRTRYLKEILLGDRIHIELQLAGTNRDGSRWFVRHIFRRGATVCAIYDAKGAWFSVAKRRLAPAPPGLLEAYSNIVRTDDYAELSSDQSVIGEVAA
jgi:acyl-CoA thioester hydrolase